MHIDLYKEVRESKLIVYSKIDHSLWDGGRSFVVNDQFLKKRQSISIPVSYFLDLFHMVTQSGVLHRKQPNKSGPVLVALLKFY